MCIVSVIGLHSSFCNSSWAWLKHSATIVNDRNMDLDAQTHDIYLRLDTNERLQRRPVSGLLRFRVLTGYRRGFIIIHPARTSHSFANP